jgi:Ketopantoate reductase
LNVDARTSTKDVEDCDVAIIAVRNYNLPEVIDHVRSLAKKGAKLISLLNGVEHIEKISAETGKDSIIGGSAYR